jgi:hypothetical protein
MKLDLGNSRWMLALLLLASVSLTGCFRECLTERRITGQKSTDRSFSVKTRIRSGKPSKRMRKRPTLFSTITSLLATLLDSLPLPSGTSSP